MTGRRTIAVEAGASLLLARLAVRFVPFQRIVSRCDRILPDREPTGASRAAIIAEVQRAIHVAAPYLPGDVVCFPRAIAAQAMLRRRGLSTTLYYGATARGGLKAHVWLQDGAQGVVGLHAAKGHHVLARYASRRRPARQTFYKLRKTT